MPLAQTFRTMPVSRDQDRSVTRCVIVLVVIAGPDLAEATVSVQAVGMDEIVVPRDLGLVLADVVHADALDRTTSSLRVDSTV